MNQKEIMEIRRRITPERTNITKIYGCYVNGEKQVISTSELSLAVMEKNDVEKYMDLFKKSLLVSVLWPRSVFHIAIHSFC